MLLLRKWRGTHVANSQIRHIIRIFNSNIFMLLLLIKTSSLTKFIFPRQGIYLTISCVSGKFGQNRIFLICLSPMININRLSVMRFDPMFLISHVYHASRHKREREREREKMIIMINDNNISLSLFLLPSAPFFHSHSMRIM